MVKVYISLDENNRVDGYGLSEFGEITKDPNDSILIDVDEDFINNPIEYYYKNGNLYKDTYKILEELKELKLEEISESCKNSILAGFDCEIDESIYHFSYDKEAQQNISERWHLFQNNMIKSINVTAKDENGKSVRLNLDYENYSKVYLTSIKHKEDNISRFRDVIQPMIERITNKEDLQLIKWDMKFIDSDFTSLQIKDDHVLKKEIEETRISSAKDSDEMINLLSMTLF